MKVLKRLNVLSAKQKLSDQQKQKLAERLNKIIANYKLGKGVNAEELHIRHKLFQNMDAYGIDDKNSVLAIVKNTTLKFYLNGNDYARISIQGYKDPYVSVIFGTDGGYTITDWSNKIDLVDAFSNLIKTKWKSYENLVDSLVKEILKFSEEINK